MMLAELETWLQKNYQAPGAGGYDDWKRRNPQEKNNVEADR